MAKRSTGTVAEEEAVGKPKTTEGGAARGAGRALPLLLGSASARRRKILRELGLRFEVAAPDLDEHIYADDPRRTAVENAERKNRWCRARHPGYAVITADTVIDLDGRLIGKPASMEEARSFLRRFSGRAHRVITGVAFSDGGAAPTVEAVESQVAFRRLDEGAIEEYLRGVDPMDKAGAYDIDQRPDLIIESFSGSRTNVMGLPAERVLEWLRGRSPG